MEVLRYPFPSGVADPAEEDVLELRLSVMCRKPKS